MKIEFNEHDYINFEDVPANTFFAWGTSLYFKTSKTKSIGACNGFEFTLLWNDKVRIVDQKL